MKRVLWFLLIAVVGAVLLFGAVVIGSKSSWERAGREPWPMQLGTLEEMAARFPKRGPSAEALHFAELARSVGIDYGNKTAKPTATDDAIRDFVEAECARDVAAIEAPPANVEQFLTQHAGAIDALAAHLRQSRDIAWEIDLDKGFTAPVPHMPSYLRASRVLIARALVRARNGDPGAWDDLHAASMLDRSLHPRPDLTPQVLALQIARRVNAAAWKLPTPAPAWLAEYHAIDRRRPILQGLQSEAWVMWRHAPGESTSRGIPYAYLRLSVANLAKHLRENAVELSQVTACGFDSTAHAEKRAEEIPRWNTIGRIAFVGAPWSRLLRYQAEREATANALRVRAGQPVIETSQCSDGTWRSENGRLRFTKEIPSKVEKEMPLSLAVEALQVVANDTAAGDHDFHVHR